MTVIEDRAGPGERRFARPEAQPLKVFINYRRADTGWAAWALYFNLAARFGADNVFLDNDTLRAGEAWFDEIRMHVVHAAVFIALIGPRWMSTLIGHLQGGQEDYVEKEIAMALGSDLPVTVIPVLVDDAQPPSAAPLPPAMKTLPSRQAEFLRCAHARDDIKRLIARLLELEGHADD